MNCEQTDSGDERLQPPGNYIADDHRVSKAPLHLAYPLRRNLSKKQLNELVEQGHVIHRGRFSQKENKRLLKNWRKIRRKYPELDNPFAAVGMSHKPEHFDGKTVDTVVDGKTKKFFKQSKILERLAYKLDDRLLCDIYTRAKKLIGGRAFKYQQRKCLPEQLAEEINEKIFKLREKPREVADELDISPFVVSNMKTNPGGAPKHSWTDEHDLLLEMSIERQSNNEDPWTIPIGEINWKEVSKEMITCGLPEKEMCPRQLCKRWYYLNSQQAKNIKRRLVTKEETTQ